MLLNSTGKIITGLASFGIIGGAGVGIYYQLNNSKEEKNVAQEQKITKNSIQEKLSKVGYQILKTDNNEDDEKWTVVLKEYIKVKAEQGLLKVTDETITGLKSQCKLIFSSENNNYPFAKRFCVMGETIGEMLKRNGYTKLGENTETGDKSKWEAKLNLIKGNEKTMQSMKLVLKNNADDVGLLVNACKALEIDNTNTYEKKDFETNYINAKDWCSLGL